MSQVCEIKAHPKLLFDIINRQAGVLSKALLEAVQNSIEACDNPNDAIVDITLDTHGASQYGEGATVTIRDNGRGIRNRTEIEEYFLTFGTPHEASEHKTWAQFRMGRGQVFSYGKNTWRTSTFRMVVDINKDKAANRFPQCHLEENLPYVDGCEIVVELYSNPVNTYGYTIEVLRDEIRKQIEFMPGTIRFNGEQLNADVRELNWTDQDENAYYLFNTGGDLAVYNLGAYVMSISPTIAGVTGAIVSKKMLKVNFARNSILESQCPVWKEINAVIVSNRVKKVRAAQRRLSSNERIATLRDLRDGVQSLEDVRTLGLFETTSDKVLRFDDIKKNTLPWVFAESGDRLADKWMQGGVALCINEEVLSALSYRGPEKDFFRWIISRCSDNHNIVESFDGVSKLHKEYAEFQSSFGGDFGYAILPHTKLTKFERRIIKVLEDMNMWDGRRVIIGTSGCAYSAWTDGKTYIALNKDYLNGLYLNSGYTGAADLMHVMFHEMAHDEDTSGTHIHGGEFYRRFHEITYRYNGQGSYGCPLAKIGDFAELVKSAARREIQESAERKEKKAKVNRDKSLGLLEIAA